MKKSTYLARELETADIMAQYDMHAKRLLADKNVLSFILINCIDEFRGYSLDEAKAAIEGEPEVSTRRIEPVGDAIWSLNSESQLPGEGKMTFDIVFTAITKDLEKHKFYFNVEAQKSFYPGYDLVTRGMVYAARLISQQMDVEYTATNYDGVKKVYSIWVCMDTPKKNHLKQPIANTITRYNLKSDTMYATAEYIENNINTYLGRYDIMSVIFICLSKETLESKDKLIDMLSTLFSNNISVDEKKDRLERVHTLPMTKEMEREAAKMCNLSEAIYEEGYEAGRTEVKEELKKMTEELESKTEELESKTEELNSKTKELEALKAKIIELEKMIK